MSTHIPGFQSFSGFLHHFVLAKLATSSMRVKDTGGQFLSGQLALSSGQCGVGAVTGRRRTSAQFLRI